MKHTINKLLASVALVPLIGTTFAADEMMTSTSMMDTMSMMEIHTSAANFLAEQNVIVDQSANVEMYNYTSNITRREMIKVAMNISGKSVPDTCMGDFTDLDSDDFACKYAEAALANGFIADNKMFRPDTLITEAESLKMIMQVKGIERDANSDWRLGYSSKAMSQGLISSEITLDAYAKRGWIFDTAALTYSEFMTEMSQE